jgi:hypothetical protein
MKFETAVKRATRELLRGDIEMEQDGNELVITEWGYDCARIRIPQTWREMIHAKVRAQLYPGGVNDIVLRYSFRIMRLTS